MRWTKTPEQRFWDKVDKSGECWTWTASGNGSGYGQFYVDGRLVYGHRFSYELVNGALQPGQFVCHRCDNPSCVRPDHLFAGSQMDNVRDAVQKGRTRGGGGDTGKLTVEQRVEAVKRVRTGEPVREVASHFQVSKAAIRHLINTGKYEGTTK